MFGIRSANINGGSQASNSLFFTDFKTSYNGTTLHLYGPSAGAGIAITSLDRVISNTAPAPAITVSGSTFNPSQISSIVRGSVLGSSSGSVLTMTPATQDTSPNIIVGGTTLTCSQVDMVSWSGVSGSFSGTTLSLSADHDMQSAGYGMSLTGSVFAATRSAPVLIISGTSYSPTIANQITWNNVTASLSNVHLTVTVPSGGSGTIAPGTTTQGSFNVNGALHVARDVTSTGGVGCSGVLATHLTVSGTGSVIPGFSKEAYEFTTWQPDTRRAWALGPMLKQHQYGRRT